MSVLSIQRGFSGVAAKTTARLVIITAALISISAIYAPDIVHALTPLLSAVFEWTAGDFKLLSMNVGENGADRVVKVAVMWKHVVQVGEVVMHPDPRGIAAASTLMAHALQGPFAGVVFACAWPSECTRPLHVYGEYAIRFLVLSPLLIALGCLDLSVMLSGELWQMVYDALDPGHQSGVIVARDFFQNGGRVAVGLFMASFATFCGRAVVARMALPAVNFDRASSSV